MGFDKFQHFLAYFVLAAAIALWFSRERWRRPGFRLPVFTAALGSLYGVIDEVHQYFVPGRNCNVWDWLFDTLGAIIAAVVVKRVLTKTGNRSMGPRRTRGPKQPIL